MPQINLAGGPHGTVTLDAGTTDETRFWPYPAGRSLDLLRRAVFIVQHNIYKQNTACNEYFRLLSGTGGGRSFDALWEDPSIWISYEPRVGLGWDGATDAVGREITLGEEAFRTGNRWYLTGVLVHELAHCNGAGGPPSRAASEALRHCGLAALYDGAIGMGPRVTSTSDERLA